jgi:hypothetical protein
MTKMLCEMIRTQLGSKTPIQMELRSVALAACVCVDCLVYTYPLRKESTRKNNKMAYSIYLLHLN